MFKVGATQALIAMARHSFIWGWLGVRARLQAGRGGMPIPKAVACLCLYPCLCLNTALVSSWHDCPPDPRPLEQVRSGRCRSGNGGTQRNIWVC